MVRFSVASSQFSVVSSNFRSRRVELRTDNGELTTFTKNRRLQRSFSSCYSLRNLKAITGYPNSLKITRRLGVFLDLLANAPDVDVDRARGDEAGVAPDGVEQVVAAEDSSGVAGKIVEETEFGGGSGDELAIDAELHGAGVDLDVFELQQGGRAWAFEAGRKGR